jgi:hypothetical protein
MTEDKKKFAVIQESLESRQNMEDKNRDIDAKLEHILRHISQRDNEHRIVAERNEEMYHR